MDGALYLALTEAGTALGSRIVGCVYDRDIAVLIFLKACTGYKVRTHKTNLVAREEAEVFARRLLHKVLTLNIKLSAERNHAGAKLRILQIVRNLEHLCLTFRIVVDDQLHRIQDCHHAGLL